MTPRAFTPPAAAPKLVEAIGADDELVDALVREGLPSEIPTKRERVYVDTGVRGLEREPGLQQGHLVETYDMELTVEIHKVGKDTYAATKARLWQILNIIDAAIEADDELDGVVAGSLLAAVDRATVSPFEDGHFGQAIARVRIQAWPDT